MFRRELFSPFTRVGLALAAVGFTSIIGQVVLMRELVAVFYGNELVFGLILAAWLLWVAVGSWVLGRWAEGRGWGRGAFVAGLVLAAAILPAQIALTRSVRTLLGLTPGLLVGLGSMVWAVALILAPLCLLLGFQFTLGARLLAGHEGTVGQAYVWEGWGAALGGALFSFVLVRWLDPFQVALAVGAVNLAVGAWVLGRGARGVRAALAVGAASGSLLLALAAGPLGGWWHQATLAAQYPDMLFGGDSPYGRLVVVGRESQRAFFENGLLMFETQSTFPEEVAHFPLLEHPDPRSVLLIGGGVGGTLREVLKHPVESVDYVELDPLVIEAARAHLPPADAAVLDDRRVRLIHADGRLYVKRTRRRFDVVIVDLPEPSTGQLNRFYTVEFFAEVRAVLRPGGVVALSLPSADNYVNPEMRRLGGSVFHTLRAVFPGIIVLPGDVNFFLASDRPLSSDHTLLTRRLAARGVETRWVNEPYLRYIFTTDRFAQVRRGLEAEPAARLNRDFEPVCYYYDVVLWLSRFYTGLSGAFYRASLIQLWWLVVPLAAVVAVARWQRAWAMPTIIAITGLAEMSLEVVIILAFQALRGYVYYEVSLIVAAFMVGAALGGATMNRLIAARRWRGGRRLLRVLIAAQGVMVVYALGLPWVLRGAAALPLATLTFPLVTLAAGFIGGLDFPLAAELTRGSVGRVAGLIYGADLVGACLGALLSSVLFVPVLGIPQTTVVVALLSVTGVVLLV